MKPGIPSNTKRKSKEVFSDMKRLLSMTLALTLILALMAGCGNQNNTTGADGANGTVTDNNTNRDDGNLADDLMDDLDPDRNGTADNNVTGNGTTDNTVTGNGTTDNAGTNNGTTNETVPENTTDTANNGTTGNQTGNQTEAVR